MININKWLYWIWRIAVYNKENNNSKWMNFQWFCQWILNELSINIIHFKIQRYSEAINLNYN